MTSTNGGGSASNIGWQSEAIDWDDRVKKLYSSQRLADVTFKFRDADNNETTLKAHSLLLAMASTVFDAMFYGDIPPEKDENGFVVEITDIDWLIFDHILRDLYETVDLVPVEEIEMLMLVYIAADKYMLNRLKDKYSTMLVNKIDQDNCIAILDYGLLMNNEPIITHAQLMLESKARESLTQLFTKSPPFTRLELLNFISFECKLNTTEVSIFRALYLWAKAVIDCEDDDIKKFVKSSIPSGTYNIFVTARQLLDALGLLKAVNFKEIASWDLKYDVFTTGMFTADEMNAMLNTDLPDSLTATYTVERRRKCDYGTIYDIRIPYNHCNYNVNNIECVFCSITINSDRDLYLLGFSCYVFGVFRLCHAEEVVFYVENTGSKPTTCNFFLSEGRKLAANVAHVFSFRVQDRMGYKESMYILNYSDKKANKGLASVSFEAKGHWPGGGAGISFFVIDSSFS